MKVLVIGSGGREHALAWRLAREGVDVIVGPGNGGTPVNAPVDVTDSEALVDLAQRERVDLTIVGPEAPLAAGVVDAFVAAGLAAFGPTRAAAQLEWSKAFAKEFLVRHGIPTAASEVVATDAAARQACARRGWPVVLKADGLAAGKGVFVVRSAADLDAACDHLFTRQTFGQAADRVLIEEYLTGPELSVLAFTDGRKVAVMPPARDYKRLQEGDRGPNTGGMGGLTWPAYATPDLLAQVERQVIRPTLAGMVDEGHPYRGVLYCGLMLTPDGPRVLEFNCRFGDPECQLILPLLEGSLSTACASAAAGTLDESALRWTPRQTFGVVLAAAGYPDAPRLGDTITGLDGLEPAVQVFHGGTRRAADGSVVTSGGRVLAVVGQDRRAVYQAAETLHFEGKQFRRDIGLDDSAAAPGADDVFAMVEAGA